MNNPPYGPVAFVIERGTFTPMLTSDDPEPRASDIQRWILDGQPRLDANGWPDMTTEGTPMQPQEVQQVLAKCAAFDNRRPDPTVIAAWGDALDRDVTLRDALEAVSTHYATSRDWIMPADINAACRTIRATRIYEEEQRHGHLLPDGLGDTPALEMTWRREAMRALGQGATREEASDGAWRSIGMEPPPAEINRSHDAQLLAAQVAGSRTRTETPSSSTKRTEKEN